MIIDPGTDINLSREAGTNKVELKVFKQEVASEADANAKLITWNLLDVTSQCKLDVFTPSGSTTSIQITQDAGKFYIEVNGGTDLQTNFIHVAFPDPMTPTLYRYAVIRVTVHKSFDGWWFGDERLTVPVNIHAPHGQLTIYASCDRTLDTFDRSVVDITGHGFVTLTPKGTASTYFTLDAENRGFITGTQVTPDDQKVEGNFKGHKEEVAVRVINFYGVEENIGGQDVRINRDFPLKKVPGYQGDPVKKHNFLFVAEGFKTEAGFETAVNKFLEITFTRQRHAPFNLLKDNFNVYTLYLPSKEEGITVTEPEPAAHISGTGDIPGYMALVQTRDSGLGMARGTWLTANFAPSLPRGTDFEPDGSVKAAVISSHCGVFKRFKVETDDPLGHSRRYPPNFTWSSSFRRMLFSLIDPTVPDTDPGFHMGKYWYPDNINTVKDHGFVCILVNDYNFRAANSGNYLTCYTDTRTKGDLNSPSKYALVHPSAHIWKVPRKYTPVLDADGAADTFVHEFGHSFKLGDEYEEEDGSFTGAQINYDNLAGIDILRIGAAPAKPAEVVEQVDVTKLKWALAHRIKKAAQIQKEVIIGAADTTISVEVEGDATDLADWQQCTTLDRAVTIYCSQIVGMIESQWEISGGKPKLIQDLTVESAVLAGATLTLTLKLKAVLGGTGGKIRARSVLYEPLRDCNGNKLFLIDPAVMDYLATKKVPLHHNKDLATPANSCKEDRGKTDFPNADFLTEMSSKTVTLPGHTFRIVGLYEGADHKACGAYRPTGACKMRNNFAVEPAADDKERGEGAFCFVCQYLIVNRINPAMHAEIEKNYPALTEVKNCPAQ
ncbi:MAG: hypothetical protein H6581_24890 [Bacteroidia bacterium]|nr:hypothetical protein [Bacteroidia bacterium]